MLRICSLSILDGYLNPLVFWYQWEYLLLNQQRIFHVAGYLRLAMCIYYIYIYILYIIYIYIYYSLGYNNGL